MLEDLNNHFKVVSTESQIKKDYSKDSFFNNSIIKNDFALYLILILDVISYLIVEPPNKDEFRKRDYAILTGIPYLKSAFFNVYFIVISIYMSYSILILCKYSDEIFIESRNLSFQEQISIFLAKMKFFTFFNSLFQFLTFSTLYGNFVIALNKAAGFKISGHFFINFFVIRLYFNFVNFINNTDIQIHSINSVKNFNFIVKLLVLHSFYNLFFTGYIYHSFLESAMGLILGHIFSYLSSKIEADELIVLLIWPKFIKKPMNNKDDINNSNKTNDTKIISDMKATEKL